MSAPPLIDYGRMLELLGAEGRLLVIATRGAPPDAPVGGASGLTVERALHRVAETFADAAERVTEPACISGGRASAPRPTPVARTPMTTGDPAGCLAARLADLLAEFGTRHAQQPCTLRQGRTQQGATRQAGARNVEYWLRRTLHTTAVHRIDVEAATSAQPAPVEPDLARDGVDEMLHSWFEYGLNAMGASASSDWSVRIEVDDHQWLASSDPPRMRVRRLEPDNRPDDPYPVDAVVAGDAASMYLWLWGRLPDRAVRVSGDYDAVAQLWSLLRLATR